VYNKMISDNEITVMAASGLSPRQLAWPALRLAVVLTGIHLLLNLWIVPASQAKFYDTQWNLRYGLAHMKLQESAFTEMADGLVVYVDKVSGHDLSQVMLSDTRDEKSQMTIFAEKGKLIATARGLSIVMTNGALQAYNDTLTAGTFDSFDMDLNVADKSGNSVFKVRRIPTWTLIKTVATQAVFGPGHEFDFGGVVRADTVAVVTAAPPRQLCPRGGGWGHGRGDGTVYVGNKHDWQFD